MRFGIFFILSSLLAVCCEASSDESTTRTTTVLAAVVNYNHIPLLRGESIHRPLIHSSSRLLFLQPFSFWSSFLQFLQCPLGPLGHKCQSDKQQPNDSNTNSNNNNMSGGQNQNSGYNNGGGSSGSGNNNGQNGSNNNGSSSSSSSYSGGGGGGGSSSSSASSYSGGGGGNQANSNYNAQGGSSSSSYSDGGNQGNNNNGSNNYNAQGGGTTSYKGVTDSSYNTGYNSPTTDSTTSLNSSSKSHVAAWSSVAIIGSVLGIAVAYALMKKPAGHILTGSVGKRKGLFERTFLNHFDSSPQGDFHGEPTSEYHRGSLV